MPLIRAARWLRTLVRLARRGATASPVEPARRRVVLLQIDGLSSARLERALARGEMPHLRRWLSSGAARLRAIEAATAPSTPVFQAGLLYGDHADVPGFGWFDRKLGRTVRMDLAEDVLAIERSILRRGHARGRARRPTLLDGGGVSYGTIWPAGAAQAFFNVTSPIQATLSSGRLDPRARRMVENVYDRLLSTWAGLAIAGRLAARFALELGVGVWDFARWCRRIRTTRFEWRFLYMRLVVSVIMRDVATQGAVVDVLRGVPVIYVDYLGYDEYAHRRGPDSEMALYNLRGIDSAIARVVRATRAVPEYGYDVYVLSDHGQTATTPFERVVGSDLHRFVLEHAFHGAAGDGSVESSAIRELVSVRETELWLRTLWRPLRPPLSLYVGWLKRRLQKSLSRAEQLNALSGIEVVTGGSIAHLYFRGLRDATVERIAARWPGLVHALARSPAIGLMVGRGRHGPVLYFRGRRYRLDDRRALERLEPFRRLGYDLLMGHLRQAVDGRRSGDLVVYGAFAEAGDIAFDFEFGSHGGIGPEELDQFVIHPARVDFPLAGAVTAEEFYRFFRERYVASAGPERDAA
ncbi:MAG TPA: alkaline phosphatase family protein [Polyangia bacterium]|nr:alkaline phosphatase family protein [Polyangia bacterium]